MNPRTLRIFAVVAVLALLVAWWAGRDPAPADGDAGGAFLPDLKQRINDVARIEIDDGEEPVRYERRGAQWVDLGRGGYPAKADEIKRLLLGLYALEKREAKTARPERHAELQLAAAGEAEGRGKVVRLFLAGEEAPAWEIVAGQAKYSPVRGIYARLAGEDQCWFLSGELPLPYQATAWLDKEVANVNQADVRSILLVRGEEQYAISRAGAEAPWALAELPEGRNLKEFAPFGSLANVLGFLNFEDVAPASEERFARGPDLAAEFGFAHGGSIRLEGWKFGEEDAPEVWVRLVSAAPAEPAAGATGDGAAGDGAADAGGPTAATLAQWEAKWQGWAYQLPQWKGSALLQGLEDWLEPLPEAPPEEPAVEQPLVEDEEGG